MMVIENEIQSLIQQILTKLLLLFLAIRCFRTNKTLNLHLHDFPQHSHRFKRILSCPRREWIKRENNSVVVPKTRRRLTMNPSMMGPCASGIFVEIARIYVRILRRKVLVRVAHGYWRFDWTLLLKIHYSFFFRKSQQFQYTLCIIFGKNFRPDTEQIYVLKK